MNNSLHIEDLIVTLASHNIGKYNNWDATLIYSFTDQIGRGLGFTEKQANLACKILRKHSNGLSVHFKTDITPYLTTPVYRFPIRTVNIIKKISIVENENYQKIIKAEFPYNEKLVNEIKNRNEQFYAAWDRDLRAWIFAISERSLNFVGNLFSEQEFEWDQEFKNYYYQCQDIKRNLEKYVPMLVLDQTGLKYANIDSNLPILESKDPISAIFEARKRGVFIWDSSIEEVLENSNLQPVTKQFLKQDPGKNFDIDSNELPMEALQDFVRYMSPCLIIIPGGSELEKLQQAHCLLKYCGIEDNKVSVTFRLPSDTGKDFNLYIKDNGLNNPISDQIKVIFVSSKLTKPLIKANLNFNCVINLGSNNVHYTMRDFVSKHENLIHYFVKNSQQPSLPIIHPFVF